jgi:hypothetical protein
MIIELAVAVAAGIMARSVALTAFGFDSGIEIFTAAVVLNRLLERTTGEERDVLTPGEKRASRLVGLGLYALIGGTLEDTTYAGFAAVRPRGQIPGAAECSTDGLG